MNITAHRALHAFNTRAFVERFYEEPQEDDCNIGRGVVNAILLSIPLWALIVWVVL